MLHAYSSHGHNNTPLRDALKALLGRDFGDEIGRNKLSHFIDEIGNQCHLAAETDHGQPNVDTWLLSVLKAIARSDESELDQLHFRERREDDY